MGALGFVLLTAGAIIIARAIHKIDAYLTGHRPTGYAVLATAIGGILGGFVTSEVLAEWGYAYDGLYVVSAALGAAVVGLVVAVAAHSVERRIVSHT